MKSLLLRRKAKDMLATLNRIDQVTGESGHTVARYLCVLAAKHPEAVTFAELGDAVGITKSQVSRTARGLHKMYMDGRPGLDLTEIGFDLQNPRVKLVTLNARGLLAMQDMLEELD